MFLLSSFSKKELMNADDTRTKKILFLRWSIFAKIQNNTTTTTFLSFFTLQIQVDTLTWKQRCWQLWTDQSLYSLLVTDNCHIKGWRIIHISYVFKYFFEIQHFICIVIWVSISPWIAWKEQAAFFGGLVFRRRCVE